MAENTPSTAVNKMQGSPNSDPKAYQPNPAGPLCNIDSKKRKDIMDQCLTSYITKGLIGIGVGLGASFLLFKRRFWPVAFTTGFALGMSHDECKRNLRSEYYKKIMDEVDQNKATQQ